MKKTGSNKKKKQKKEKKTGAPRKLAESFVSVLNGNFLTKEEAVKHLPFLLFLSLLALIYIANGYTAEGNIRSINQSENELKELRSEYITTKSDLMYQSKQSQVARTLDDKQMGLKQSVTPPKKIVVTEKELDELASN